MKTKLFTLLFAVAASIGTMNAAIVNGTCGDNLTWSLNTKDSTLTIEGSGAMTDFNKNDGAPWFDHRSYIKIVYLPNGVTSIGNYAFHGCTGLTSVSIPNSVTSIGNYAFQGCTGLTSVSIPNSVTSIGSGAFRNCSSLTSITIPNSVTKIGMSAFRECTGLTSVTIPNSVTSIGNYAFEYCSSLTSVVIPNSVTSIGEDAFYGVLYVNIIYYSGTIEQWCSKFWSPNQISRNYTLYIGNNKVSDLVIPNSVTSIGGSAFYGCTSLTSVTIPNSVTSIGSDAFSGCNLSTITCEAVVPPTITNSTFSNKSGLLFVPEESIEAYQNALYWDAFTDIRAIGSAPLVQFVDWDGTVLSSANVTIGTAATPPADPTRTGYTFIGWDKDFSNITEDLVVTAQYQINRYKVDFIDWDNSILKTDSVEYNAAAIAPANPSREGHEFFGWDKDFSHVTSDMTITAQYAINYYPVGFLNYDGTLLSEQSIAYNQAAMEPEVPAREGYTFIGWTADVTHITARTFAIALYEKQDLLLVTYKNEEGETISTENVDLHLPEAPKIEGFTFIGWQASGMLEEDGIILQAVYTADSQTSAPAVVVNPANKAQKLIRNGNVYILTDTKTYTIQGQVK